MRFSRADLLCLADDISQKLNARALFGCAQFRIANDVEKEDVREFKAQSGFLVASHARPNYPCLGANSRLFARPGGAGSFSVT